MCSQGMCIDECLRGIYWLSEMVYQNIMKKGSIILPDDDSYRAILLN